MANTKTPPKNIKKVVDWLAVEKDYRAGITSNHQIGRKFGCSETAVRKKAKEFEWKKDLAAAIRARAQELVRTQEVRDSVRAEIDDSQIIEDNANLQANVIRSHQTKISRYQSLCDALLSEIETQTGNRMSFEEFGEIMFSPSENGKDLRNELYNKIISTSGRVDNIKKLADTLKTLISLEREAFSIDAKQSVGETLESILEKLDAEG